MSDKKKLMKLNNEQVALLVVKRDEWIKIGLSTEPANLRFRNGGDLEHIVPIT